MQIKVHRIRELFGICKKYNAKVYEDGNDAVGVLGLVCMKEGRAFACPESQNCPILANNFDIDWFEVKEVGAMADLTCPDCYYFDNKEVQCEIIEKLPRSYPFGDVIAKCPECGYEWVF